jgi:hypothetical protein
MAGSTASERRRAPLPLGPFDRQPWCPEASVPEPDRDWHQWGRERMLEALAGVELGEYDRRQETNGDLVCHRCGRMVSSEEGDR